MKKTSDRKLVFTVAILLKGNNLFSQNNKELIVLVNRLDFFYFPLMAAAATHGDY